QYNFAAECDDIPCIPIDPLSHATPDQPSEWNAESVVRMEATRLFVAATRGRIRQLTPETWEPIARICHVFRGHPLSISLAAGELASSPRLTLNDLAERIQSNPAKGTMSNLSADFDYKTKSLAASVRWSMSLCSEAEQRFLYAVAYLTDGFTEECGNRIRASSTHAHDETIRSVAHFCNASLLQALPRSRYRLIECVRTELEASANAGGSEHLERCLDGLTEEVRLCGCDGVCDPSHESLVTLASERGNVRRLVAAALSDSDLGVKTKGMILLAEYLPGLCRIDMPQYITDTYSECLKWTHLLPLPLACRLVRLISRSMWAIGQWTDAASLIHDLIEQNRASFRTTTTAGIEWGWHDCCDLALLLADRVRLGCLASRHGSFVNRQMSFDDLMVMISEADTLCHLRRHFAPDNALTRKREASLRALMAERRAQVLDSNGSYALAAECVNQITTDRISWSLLSTQQQGEIKNRLGLACWHAGQLDTAEECFRHAASLFSKAGDTMWQAGALTNLAFVMTDLEMFASSIQCCETAEGLHKAVGNLVWEAINLGAWGNALAWSGDYKLGLAKLEQGLTLLKAADPDTRAQFSGDIARVLLFHNTAHTDARAKLLLEQALAFQTNSGKPTRRMFGNTVLLAHAGYRLARPISERQGFARQARQIATELGLTDQSPVLQVRRDLTLLNQIELDLSQHTDAQS
ncbi:MAG: hypothetical protein RL215_428, partial [Planctomycetota bacterium]